MAQEYIDAHHHLWRYQHEEYLWIGDGMETRRQDYLIAELEAVMREAGVNGTVAVQARQTIQETEWLSGLATRSDLIRGVEGWAPLASADGENSDFQPSITRSAT